MKLFLAIVLAFVLAMLAHAQGPITYPGVRTDACVGPVATPSVTPTALSWSAGVATVTTTLNPGTQIWLYFTGYTGAAVAWNVGFVQTTTSSPTNITFAWAPALPTTSSGIGTVGFCNVSAATGAFGAPLIYQEGTSDPVPFFRLDADTTPGNCLSYTPSPFTNCATAGTPFVDPDFGSYSIFVTDQTTTLSTTTFSMGSDGGYDAFGLGYPNDVMMTWTNSGGVKYLTHILESNFLAHNCATSKCVVLSNILGSNCTPTPGVYTGAGICTQQQIVNGGGSFSRNATDTPNTMYEANIPIITKTVIATGSTMGVNDSVTRTAYINFSTDLGGGPCSVLPLHFVTTWTGGLVISDKGAITMALGGGGSYADFVPSNSTVLTPDTFVLPVNNIAGIANFMFQASSGTTAVVLSEPNWSANCPTQGSTCFDGSVTWTNIGKVSGQGPGFLVVHFDPLRGCSLINTRLSKIYRGVNEGVSWPNPGSPDASGQLITDDAVTCFRMGGTSCGTGGTVNMTDKFTLHAGSQKFNSQYGEITATGGGGLNKNYAGGGGSWPEISPTPTGSCVTTTTYTTFPNWPNSVWVSGSNYNNGNFEVSPANRAFYKLITTAYAPITGVPSVTDPSLDPTNWKYSSAYCYVYIVDWYTNVARAVQELGPNFGGSGHSAEGYTSDFRGGVYWAHYYNIPNCPSNTGPCSYVGAPNPGTRVLSNSLPNDGHPTTRQMGVGDLQPIFDPTFSVPAWGGVGMPMVQGGGTGVGGYSGACYNEECAFSTDGLQLVSRFGHSYNTGSNPGFGIQSAIGVISKDGKMLAYTSDFMNSRGDRTSLVSPATCVNPLRGQYQPSTLGTVTYLDYVLPLGNNGPQNIFQVVGFYSGTFPSGSYVLSGTGTEGAALPNWNTSCPALGNYCTTDGTNNPATGHPLDGNVLWKNLGPNSCRGDIALMAVGSLVAAPPLTAPIITMFAKARKP